MKLKNRFKDKSSKFLLIFLSVLIFLALTGCMKLLNLQVPDGIYVVGDWNGWMPTNNDKMNYDAQIDAYTFTLPSSSITYAKTSSGDNLFVGSYKVLYRQSGVTKVSSNIYVWKDNLDTSESSQTITVYATPTVMEDGKAKGVGDSEKATGDWYIGGSFNNWTLEKMTYDATENIYYLEKSVTLADPNVQYKMARNADWKPYELQYDGQTYNAGYGVQATFVSPKTGAVTLVFQYDPKFSILTCKLKED